LPKIEDNKKELRGDNINNIIRNDAAARHIHTFFVDFEYSIINCVLVKDVGESIYTIIYYL